jgi:hypothetical protein
MAQASRLRAQKQQDRTTAEKPRCSFRPKGAGVTSGAASRSPAELDAVNKKSTRGAKMVHDSAESHPRPFPSEPRFE